MATEGMAQMQETDFVPSFKQVSKWAYRVTKPEKIPWAMRRAFTVAMSGRPGPVFLEIPMDVGGSDYVREDYVQVLPRKFRPDEKDVAYAVNLMAKAERPVIIAGGGIYYSRAFKELLDVAESLAIPILTTASGRGAIPEDHPLACGLVGIYRTGISKQTCENADLLITIGSKNEEFETLVWKTFPEQAKLIYVDVEPTDVGRNLVPDVAVIGDAKLALSDLRAHLSEAIRKDRVKSQRLSDITKAKAEYEAIVEADCKTNDKPIRTMRIVRDLNKVFGKNTILANENGSQDLWSYYFPYYKVLDAGACMGMPEQTCFGLGIVGAIAAKLTRPDMNVVCTTGDGAFQFAMKEVPTAVQYDAPVTWTVFNNYGLRWEEYYQKYWSDSGKIRSTKFEAQPDFTKFAEANKCFGRRVEEPGDITSALQEALDANKNGTPAILDFIVSTFDFPEHFYDYHEIAWGKPKRSVTVQS
jgi:acetolactate synthase-1/2/3 large subunit